MAVLINGRDLTIEEVIRVCREDEEVKLAEESVAAVNKSRAYIEKKLKEKAENKGEKHLTTAGYASIISRSVKVDKWKPKPRQPFSIDNDSHLRWNRGL